MEKAVETFYLNNGKNPLVNDFRLYSDLASPAKNYLRAIGATPTKKTGIDILDCKKIEVIYSHTEGREHLRVNKKDLPDNISIMEFYEMRGMAILASKYVGADDINECFENAMKMNETTTECGTALQDFKFLLSNQLGIESDTSETGFMSLSPKVLNVFKEEEIRDAVSSLDISPFENSKELELFALAYKERKEAGTLDVSAFSDAIRTLRYKTFDTQSEVEFSDRILVYENCYNACKAATQATGHADIWERIKEDFANDLCHEDTAGRLTLFCGRAIKERGEKCLTSFCAYDKVYHPEQKTNIITNRPIDTTDIEELADKYMDAHTVTVTGRSSAGLIYTDYYGEKGTVKDVESLKCPLTAYDTVDDFERWSLLNGHYQISTKHISGDGVTDFKETAEYMLRYAPDPKCCEEVITQMMDPGSHKGNPYAFFNGPNGENLLTSALCTTATTKFPAFHMPGQDWGNQTSMGNQNAQGGRGQ